MTTGQTRKHGLGIPTNVRVTLQPLQWCCLVGVWVGELGEEQSCLIPRVAAPCILSRLPPCYSQYARGGWCARRYWRAQCQRQTWDLMPSCSRVAGIAESLKKSHKHQLHPEAEGCKHEHPPALALPVHRAERAMWMGGDGGTRRVPLAGIWSPAVPSSTRPFLCHQPPNKMKERKAECWKLKSVTAAWGYQNVGRRWEPAATRAAWEERPLSFHPRIPLGCSWRTKSLVAESTGPTQPLTLWGFVYGQFLLVQNFWKGIKLSYYF